MREGAEPYRFIMLEPRCRRGGTMRPENSSKVWAKTCCERSRLTTDWSGVTPASPEAIACCEMPLAAASALNSASQASKLPDPQATAARAGSTDETDAVMARAARARREIVGVIRLN